MRHHHTRREMLRNTAVAGIGLLLPGSTGRGRAASPNEKLNIALVACGGRGASNLQSVSGENIVALCDVDERRAAAAFEKYPNVKKYHDYRVMLDEMDRQIDAVVVSTPNHHHAPASVTAMRMGKHCYCEKPLTHCVDEARVAADVAAEHKLATQMGTQIHAGSNYRRVVELIQSGSIGAVRECHVCFGGGRNAGPRPPQTPAVPEGLHWDLWLGPAPERPYHPVYVPHDWHYFWDFGGGTLGNFGCHYMDLPFWALKLRHPLSVEAEGPPPDPEITPKSLKLIYQFAAREDMPPVTLTWTMGGLRPPAASGEGFPDWSSFVLFVGEKGMVVADYQRRILLPEEQFADFRPPDPFIPDSVGHHQEWILACKTGSPTTCHFGYAGPLTEAVLLGNVAHRLGRKIEWDPIGLKVTNGPEADGLLRREYRKGWTL